MNTTAILEAAPFTALTAAIPGPFPGPAPAHPARLVSPGAALRPVRQGTRPAAPARSPAWEIVAGALLLVAWALLWSFFLTGVVEPGAALERGERAAAAVSLQPAAR